MAESTEVQPVTPAAPSSNRNSSSILSAVSSFLRTTTWISAGLVLLFLGVICKVKRPIPLAWEPFFAHYIPHLPYFICGFGFMFLARARSLLRQQYEIEQKKDYFYPHTWKISLLGTQVLFLYAIGIYAVLFGLNKVPAVGMLGLVFFVACFLIYIIGYQIEYFKNRLPAFATLRISMMAFVFAVFSYALWTLYQMIVPSLVFAFLGIYAGFYALGSSGTVTQKFSWLKYILMVATVSLLGMVGYDALALVKPEDTSQPLNTVVVAKGLKGEISDLAYSPKGDEIVFHQEVDGQWFLQTVSSDNPAPVVTQLNDVDGPFHSVFIDGENLLIDAPQDGDRGLVEVNTATGNQTPLVKSGVQPFSGGAPWSDANRQFLFVTQTKKGFDLNTWTPGQKKPVVLYSSPASILSPAWLDARDVAYVDGVHATPYVLNLTDKSVTPIIVDEEEKTEDGPVETDPLVEVLPSPDHFRYLCIAQKDGQTTLWTMLTDGTKRQEIYKTSNEISDIAWLTDSQKIVFERAGLQRGFKNSIKGVVLLNANLGTTQDLIPPQISSHSPATSPDGIKIAFVSSEGLWYPSLDSGIWVAVLR